MLYPYARQECWLGMHRSPLTRRLRAEHQSHGGTVCGGIRLRLGPTAELLFGEGVDAAIAMVLESDCETPWGVLFC